MHVCWTILQVFLTRLQQTKLGESHQVARTYGSAWPLNLRKPLRRYVALVQVSHVLNIQDLNT
jgi:hypothetical protein